MLRIDKKLVSYVDGLVMHEETPLMSYLYCKHEDFYEVIKYQDGKPVDFSDDDSDWMARPYQNVDDLIMDPGNCDEDDRIFTCDNKPFTGVAFQSEEGFTINEFVVENSVVLDFRGWGRSGAFCDVISSRSNILLEYIFRGYLESPKLWVRLTLPENNDIELYFEYPEGCLSSLTLGVDTFLDFEELMKRIRKVFPECGLRSKVGDFFRIRVRDSGRLDKALDSILSGLDISNLKLVTIPSRQSLSPEKLEDVESTGLELTW